MSFTWTAHRFSGGALALDVANSVVLRFDPERRVDRFADPAAMDSFAEAASLYSAERERFGMLVPAPPENRKSLIGLREATDRHFRAQVEAEDRPDLLADLLETIAAVLRQRAGNSQGTALDVATAHSALSLVANPEPDRLKICPNCCWLFLDRSRNRSRTWCDMAVCGNRTKARRHYRRNRQGDQP
ncbi:MULTISPECIES: CGNR zinc finger domain-containing protein [unclassified Sinorhizobium]|uniref:CGNR zinc finger domain-containing protein n=1 Tax=unclassified Sinorhizobium TaxID=2613772 RepID=UPI0024C35987|nr:MULTISPECIES: CGNR zinc finger domain-containing protein [unclassified Sinorhizobium]MDK1376327.1 CGNR zinc finger domain-containing protein [Sinorhizobium sp. 6-70]MDK1478132.1 CGNR zinc finger domain-containing protein [Sinorhizobium sp. 6-117]